MKKELIKVNIIVGKFKSNNESVMKEINEVSEKMLKICDKMASSWSNSYAGYHARLYYGNYEVPPIDRMFNIEWGGLYGIPKGWQDKTPEIIKADIEEFVGNHFTIENYEKNVEKIKNEAKQLLDDILVNISQIKFDKNLSKEEDLYKTIEKYKLGESKNEFIYNNMPKSMMSRDSTAIHQGRTVPSHLYYAGVAREGKSIVNSLKELFRLIERFVKQLDLKTESKEEDQEGSMKTLEGVHPKIFEKCKDLYKKDTYAEAVEKGFKVVRDRLRELTGHETGSEAFGKGKLHIKGASALHVDKDFNEAVKFLTMAIDNFRNEKAHTSDAKIDDPVRAYHYLIISSLAMYLLDNAKILP